MCLLIVSATMAETETVVLTGPDEVAVCPAGVTVAVSDSVELAWKAPDCVRTIRFVNVTDPLELWDDEAQSRLVTTGALAPGV